MEYIINRAKDSENYISLDDYNIKVPNLIFTITKPNLCYSKEQDIYIIGAYTNMFLQSLAHRGLLVCG